MKSARYLFRLDDACSYQKKENWERVLSLFSSYFIKPLIAIIPDCQDPELCMLPYQDDFWEQARQWQADEYPLALHGYQHRFHKTKKNLIPLNPYSEFSELPLKEQRSKIKKAWGIVKEQGLLLHYWVAPAHSFDANTLLALQEETSIRIISDGFALTPFRWKGFLWIPQQLWHPRPMMGGTYTICLHPNEMEEKDFLLLQRFLERYHQSCPSWDEVAQNKYAAFPWRRWEHKLFMYAKILKNKLKKRNN
ncbi:DUF2334 domain-containing protein [Treponema sp. J25]|uniref:DUF2334 domain-containing protein n=1 Tax=Treponema sp. J25 TaxID=2094121 RepID=UPI001048C198|nr:DUF2334 domain-containing protein [Treponema sp. J25]TCW60523.1 hypothetical protein C5O22_11095 [Treponema sp. J25]